MALATITVHDPELCDKFFECASQLKDITKGSSCSPTSTATAIRQKDTLSSRVVTIPRSASSEFRAREWLTMKSRRNVMILPSDPELERILQDCLRITESERELLENIDGFLDNHTTQTKLKKEMLFKQWSERVFDPIHSSVKYCMKYVWPLLDREKRQLFNEYLRTTNKKNVFLETDDASGYNPLSLTSNEKSAKTLVLNDPLIIQRIDHAHEQQVIKGCEEGTRVSERQAIVQDYEGMGRQDTDPVLWLAMELIQIDSSVRERTRKRITGIRNYRNVDNGLNVEDSSSSMLTAKTSHKKLMKIKKDSINLHWRL